MLRRRPLAIPRPLRRPFLLALVASTGALAVVVGCGSGEDGGSTTDEAPDGSTTQGTDGSTSPTADGSTPSKDGSSPDGSSGPSGPFTISGKVLGLGLLPKDGGAPDADAATDAGTDAGDGGAAKHLVLSDNGTDDLTISGNGPFTFATKIAKAGAYAVTVRTQPGPLPAQTCVVANGSGTASSDVSDVTVTCTTNTYSLGGTVKGLDNGESVVLQHEGGGDLTVQANGAFTFAQKIASGTDYAVTVKTAPANKSCYVTSGTGTILDTNVADVVVDCSIRRSCAEHKAANPAAADGMYPIDPDATGGNAPFEAYCDMTSAGGGWTLLVWTGDAATGTYGVPYPGYAQCPTLDCTRGSGVPIAALKSLFSVSKELAKGQSVSAATKATYGDLASYQYAGRYDYGSLDGLDVNYSAVVACTGFKTGTYHDVTNTVSSDGAAVYLSQAFAYGNHNDFSADTNGRSIWDVGVPSNYCNGSGSMPGSWMGNWSPSGQYGPGAPSSAGSYAVYIR